MVVADTDTGAPTAPPSAASASARRGPTFGRLPTTWTAALPIRKPAARTRRGGLLEQRGAGGARPLRVRRTELRAEVAQAGRREQRVAERVRGDVAVRVALEPLRLVRPGQPGQVQGYAVGVPVHVDAQPHAGQACSVPGSLTRRIMPRPPAGA